MNRISTVLGAAIVLHLSACNRDSGAASAPVTSAGPGKGRVSYHLVVERRPQSVKDYINQVSRPHHELCAVAARAKGHTVQPFPTIPDDFVPYRKTYASDGASFYYQEISYTVGPFEPEQGCAGAIKQQKNTSVEVGGMQYHVDPLPPGEREEPPTPNPVAELSYSDFASHAIARTVNGVPLKCAAPLPSDPLADQGCIIDPARGHVAGSDGEPILAHLRHVGMVGMYGTLLVDQPVSLRVGDKVDAALFATTVRH